MLGGLFMFLRMVVNARLAAARSSTLPFAITLEKDVRKYLQCHGDEIGLFEKVCEDSQAPEWEHVKSRGKLTCIRYGGKVRLLMVCKLLTLS